MLTDLHNICIVGKRKD